MCTTPSSCTSTGEVRRPTAQSTPWTDADTQWRYSMVSRRSYTVTSRLSKHTDAVQPSLNVSVDFLYFQMHIVNIKSIHPNLSAALDDPTGLAVLGFFIDVVYADNVHFGHISQKLSSVAYKGQATKVKPFPLMSLLPKHNMSQYYRYYGSLTTPPCSQAVVWTLYEVPIYISWSQLAQFTSQIFSTEEDAEQVTPLQNNFRHIHHILSRVVSASIDAKLLRGAAGRTLWSATSVHLLPVLLLGCFLPGL
uniref:Carbonic anhydrase 15 n=1 Tax=Oreochromis niloticus TaxID=8128 RepID=A0A669CHX7_ORENI